MTTHRPPDEILVDYASGTTSPGVSLLVASHLTHAPESRARVREFERLGGILLSEEAPAEMAPNALDEVLGRLDDPEVSPTTRLQAGPLPQPLVDRIGLNFDQIGWKTRLPGVAIYDLDGFEDEKVMLLRAKPGAKVPQHTHEGSELTLVLQGCLHDGGVDYSRGDVAVNDEDDDHRPYATGDEICYCLIVQQGDLRFTGTFSRILNYLGE